jgi:outer membrane protein
MIKSKGEIMYKIITVFMATALLLISATVSFAGEVAFVDFEKALQLTDKGRDLQKKLAAMKDDMELEMRKMQLNLRKMDEEFAAQKDVLSEESKKAKWQEMQKGMMQYQQSLGQYEQSFEQNRVKLIRSFVGDLEAVATVVAKEQGYKIVILKTEDAIIRRPLVIYGDSSVDLTDLIVKRLNEKG